MNTYPAPHIISTFIMGAAVALGLAGCGGSSGPSSSQTTSEASTTASKQTTSTTPVPAPASSQDSPADNTNSQLPALAMPANIANGSVLELECGRHYQGTLDLKGKTNVTVKVTGTCGKAVLTPGQVITGWTQYKDNIYSAPISFVPAQVSIGGNPVSAAHWPNQPQTWVRANGTTSTSLTYAMPNGDLTGATLVFRAYEWAIETRKITGYANNVISVASTSNPNYGGYALKGTPEFYVEGKLWMLDEPGEWAVSDGRLYVWTPDGQSPEGRTQASPDRHGIDASNSNGVFISGVRITGATNGIHATGAVNLKVSDTEIVNSAGNGIVNSGGSGLSVDQVSIRNSRHNGILVKWGGGKEIIRNSRIEASGTIGMPVNAYAAIALTLSDGASVSNNIVTNSSYIGIRVFRNATVANNTVDSACLILSDCGGVYTSARDRLPLNTRIDSNTIRNVGQQHRLAWAIFMDDGANGTHVANNTMTDNRNGLFIHNGFSNTITGNTFSRSRQAHIQMAESGTLGNVRNNAVTGNTFSSTGGEETYRVSSDFGTTSVVQFGSYDRNAYTSSSATFANFNGELISFAQWKTRTGQDGMSTMSAP